MIASCSANAQLVVVVLKGGKSDRVLRHRAKTPILKNDLNT